MRYQLIVFDMDGTLLNSRGFAARAIGEAFGTFAARFGLATVPDQPTITAQIGKPAREFYEELLPASHKELWPELHALASANERRILALGEAELFAGALEIVKGLRAKGVRTAILSNCSDDYLKAVSDAFGFESYFDDLMCVGFEARKNKTQLLAEAISRHQSGRTLMVGDRFHDRDAALANGCDFAAALYGYGNAEELLPATLEFTSPTELFSILKLDT